MTPWLPLDDTPLNAAQLQALDPGRLTPLIGTLEGYFVRWLGPRTPGNTVHRVGVFGGLGQGKSTAVHAARDAAIRKASEGRLLKRLWYQHQIATFEASHFTADALEWQFFKSALLPRIARHILVLLVVALSTAALAACYLLFGNPGTDGQVGLHGYTTNLPTISKWLSELWKEFKPALSLLLGASTLVLAGLGVTAASQDGAFMVLARLTRAVPRVLVVDDLDRAKVEQQRAFLRLLGRLSRRRGFAVVVCLDETEVLRSTADPEAPDELLRKTLDVELHLPDRGREDVIALVLSINKQACARNPDPAQTRILRDPQWLGDLVRVLHLLAPTGQIGPRRVKHLLNDVGQWAHMLGAVDVDDWCALLRLHSLYSLAPELRRHADETRRALEAESVQHLNGLLTKHLGSGPDQAVLIAKVVLLFERTRMMQPSMHDGWFRLLSGLGGQQQAHAAAAGAGAAPGQRPLPHRLEMDGNAYLYSRLFIEAGELQIQGYDASMESIKNDPHQWNFRLPSIEVVFNIGDCRAPAAPAPPILAGGALPAHWADGNQKSSAMRAHEWLCWVALLATSHDAAHENGLAALDEWLKGMANASHAAWLAKLVLREQLADFKWVSGQSPTELAELLQRAEANGLLYHAHLQGQSLAQVASLLSHSAAPVHHRRANMMLRALAVDVPGAAASNGARQPLLALLWPPLQPHGNPEVQTRALEQLARLGSADLDWLGVPPDAWLRAWHGLPGSRLTTADCLRLLAKRGYKGTDGMGGFVWNFDHVNAWLQRTNSLPPALRLVCHGPASEWSGTQRDMSGPAWLAALPLAAALDWPLPADYLIHVEPRHDAHLATLLRLALERLVSLGKLQENQAGWLNPEAGQFLRTCLLRSKPHCDAQTLASVANSVATLLGATGRDLLAVTGWAPAALPELQS